MKIRRILALAFLTVAAPTFAWAGPLSVPGVMYIGNSFSTVGLYQDNYAFSIGESADAGGLVLELDPLLNKLDIDVYKVSLAGVDYAGPAGLGLYNFGTLGIGTYTLSIFSNVTRDPGLFRIGVGYTGALMLKDSKAKTVPEPGTLALFGLGLIGVAFAARRQRSRSSL